MATHISGDGIVTPAIETLDPATRPLAQIVTYQTGVVATGTTLIPFDNTIPQNTEGDQYMSLAITPKNINSTLEIDAEWNGSSSAGNYIAIAMFQDTTASALAVANANNFIPNASTQVKLKHIMTAGTISATTFKIRVGGITASTTTFNGFNATQHFGGVMASRITIKEYLP